MRLIVRILANAGAVWIASKVVPGIVFTGTLINLLIAGVIFGLIHSFVKPVVEILSFPFILLTFGLFHIIITIVLFLLAASFIPDLTIKGAWAMAGGILIISMANHILTSLFKRKFYSH